MENKRTFRTLFWLSAFLMLVAIFPIMPTFDAWTTTSAPNPDALDFEELLPQGEYWRPWDVLYAHFVGRFPDLFPYLNHLFIWFVHVFNCLITFVIARRLGFSERVSYIAMIYFFICPAMLGVVADVDSIHQVAAMGFALLSLYVYLGNSNRGKRIFLWIFFVLIGTLAKESCFAFMLIPPFISWGFKRTDHKMFFSDMVWAILFGLLYMVLRFSLNNSDIASEYITIQVSQLIKNAAIFILFHIPVILLLVFKLYSIKERKILILICCIFFASVLHLASIYATMHTYVSLPFAAIIFAIVVERFKNKRAILVVALTLSIVIDVYLIKKTYDSGELGMRLAQEAIDKTAEPSDSIYTVSVTAGSRGFSTFIVRDYNAFAWGIFSRFLNGFVWPSELKDTTIDKNPDAEALNDIINKGKKSGFKTFWIVRGDSVQVIQNK